MTKIISWNVNGIRAWYKKGALKELLKEKPDIFCFQETKAHHEQLPEELRNVPGYTSYFDHSKGKKGYSGVAIYVKNELLSPLSSSSTHRVSSEEFPSARTEADEPSRGQEIFLQKNTRDSSSVSKSEIRSTKFETNSNVQNNKFKTNSADWIPPEFTLVNTGAGMTNNRDDKLRIDYGLGIPELDQEGRFLAVHLKDFTIITCYFPNAGVKPERLEFKMKFYDAFLAYIEKLKKKQPNIIFCGDVNTAHNEIDLARPKANENHTGFLRIERDWIDKIVKKGWIDSFRHLHPKKIQYSWWDMKTFARNRNIGWRIDYFFVSPALEKKIKKAEILDQMLGSDHCPIVLEVESRK
jgi:exodeoxyribonuclease-3